jgi:hypothetical protein
MESPRGVQPAFAGQRSAHSTTVSNYCIYMLNKVCRNQGIPEFIM